MKRVCHCPILVLVVAVTAHTVCEDGWAGMLGRHDDTACASRHERRAANPARQFQEIPGASQPTVFLTRGLRQQRTTFHLPEGFDPKKAYPILLFLHGMRLMAEDNDQQPSRGLRLEITRNPKQFDSFIAVFPKVGVNKLWIGEMVEQAVKALDQTVAEFKANPRRLYLMGASMGGYGVFYTAAKYPGKFAALVAIGGGILPPGTQKVPPQFRSLVPADVASCMTRKIYLAFAR